MAYFTVVPTVVRKSKILTSNEKDVYYEIFDRCNQAGLRYCTISYVTGSGDSTGLEEVRSDYTTMVLYENYRFSISV